MEICCIVQCDQTRIESFKLRILVYEIETGALNELAGVNVISQYEGYKIPVNYKVLKIVKGLSLDFVIVNKTDEKVEGVLNQYLLFYCISTRMIVHRMSVEEVCQYSTSSSCDIRSSCIFQISNTRVLIAAPHTDISKSMYSRRHNPQIEFKRDQLMKEITLEGYDLEVQGLTNNIRIRLDSMFVFKKPSMSLMYVIVGIFSFLTLVVIFVLVLYKNWRADEESQPMSSARNRLEDERYASIHITGNSSFTH